MVGPGDGIPQSNFAIRKDMHRETSPRHGDVKLCFVRLAERPNRHADNDLVDGLGLAGVAGDSYSLIEMQSGPSQTGDSSLSGFVAMILLVLLQSFSSSLSFSFSTSQAASKRPNRRGRGETLRSPFSGNVIRFPQAKFRDR